MSKAFQNYLVAAKINNGLRKDHYLFKREKGNNITLLSAACKIRKVAIPEVFFGNEAQNEAQ
jgi:hypothetical protein